MQKSAEGTPTNLTSPWHTVTEMVLRQLPRRGPNCLFSEEILHGGNHPDDLLELGSLIHAGGLVPGQYNENSLAGLPDAAQLAAGIRGKLFGRRPGVGGGLFDHRRLQLVQPGKMKVGPPIPYSPLEERTTPAPTSSLTRWLAAMTTSGFPDRTITVC